MARRLARSELIAPKKYLDMYDPAKIPDPPAQPEQCKGVPEVAHKFGKSADMGKANEKPGRAAGQGKTLDHRHNRRQGFDILAPEFARRWPGLLPFPRTL